MVPYSTVSAENCSFISQFLQEAGASESFWLTGNPSRIVRASRGTQRTEMTEVPSRALSHQKRELPIVRIPFVV